MSIDGRLTIHSLAFSLRHLRPLRLVVLFCHRILRASIVFLFPGVSVRNIELKSQLADYDAAHRVASALATKRLGTQHQIDTYFHCRHGRLKLRQIDGLRAELVWYVRADQEGPKQSDYQVAPLANPETLKAALTAALGVRAVVQKRREIFLYHSVRIHLDDVVGLGHFLEFEAVLGPEVDEAAGLALIDSLMRHFAISPAHLLANSYAEMV
jgi:adenylate cyclase, class 2